MRARELKAEFEAIVAEDPKYDKAKAILDAVFEDAIQYMLEPSDYHVSLRATNWKKNTDDVQNHQNKLIVAAFCRVSTKNEE